MRFGSIIITKKTLAVRNCFHLAQIYHLKGIMRNIAHS